MSLKITGFGSCVPENYVLNEDLEKFLDTSDEWIETRTGVCGRHISTTETSTDLSAAAADEAIENAGINKEDIDLIIGATIQGDFITPSLACMVQGELGLSCPAFDINVACSGFIFALDICEKYFLSGKAEKILVVCCEMMSKMVDWNDRKTCVLFGDGASACVVEKGSALKYINLTSEGGNHMLRLDGKTGNNPFKVQTETNRTRYESLFMDGKEVFKYAVATIEKELLRALEITKKTMDDIAYFIIHQANKRIIDNVRAKLRQSEDKFPLNIREYGNISSATIPMLLGKMIKEKQIKIGDVLFLSAFGSGMASGSCILVWE